MLSYYTSTSSLRAMLLATWSTVIVAQSLQVPQAWTVRLLSLPQTFSYIHCRYRSLPPISAANHEKHLHLKRPLRSLSTRLIHDNLNSLRVSRCLLVDMRDGLLKGRKGLTDVQYLSSFFSGLAIQDYLSGNATWNNTVTQRMGEWTKEFGLYGGSGASTGYTPDANYWGLAFY